MSLAPIDPAPGARGSDVPVTSTAADRLQDEPTPPVAPDAVAIGTIQASRSHEISNRNIAARLPRLCSRQVERRVIPDYCDSRTGSAVSATRQLPTRGALDTANWRG